MEKVRTHLKHVRIEVKSKNLIIVLTFHDKAFRVNRIGIKGNFLDFVSGSMNGHKGIDPTTVQLTSSLL